MQRLIAAAEGERCTDAVGLILQIGMLSRICRVNVGFGQLTRICLDNIQIGGINPIKLEYFQNQNLESWVIVDR